MPDVVFNLWLVPLAEKKGWPFVEPTDDTSNTTWHDALGGLPLKTWVDVEWSMIEIEPKIELFNPYGQLILRLMIDSLAQPVLQVRLKLESTEERLALCAEYIRQHGCLPAPIIVMRRNGWLDLVDGSHRMAALFHVGCPPQYRVPAWIPEIEDKCDNLV